MPSALHLPSDIKLVFRSPLMSTKTGTKDNLLVIRDNTSGYNLLIDTVAEVGIPPATSRHIKNLQLTRFLTGPDGKSIPPFCTNLHSIVLGTKK